MKTYTEAELVQLGLCLQCCDYAAIRLVKQTARIKAGVDVKNRADHGFFIERIFLVKGFIINFSQVLSFFHKAEDKDLFKLMTSTDEQRQSFYENIRGVSAHIPIFDEYIKGVSELMAGTGGVNWFMEFNIVKKYLKTLINDISENEANNFLEDWDNFSKELSQA
jgi:hypothetical protein